MQDVPYEHVDAKGKSYEKVVGIKKPTMTKEEIETVAYEIESWLQDAAGDMAYGAMDGYFSYEDPWEAKIKKAKESGVIDVEGWLADEIYDDVDTICDLCGDRIYDECKNNHENYIAIAEEIKIGGHTSLVIAMNQLIANKKK